jgi:hypothetical protein
MASLRAVGDPHRAVCDPHHAGGDAGITRAAMRAVRMLRYPFPMPARRGADSQATATTSDAGGSAGLEPSPRLHFGQRLLLVLPNVRREKKQKKEKEPINDWLRRTFMKPEAPGSERKPKVPELPESVEELEWLGKKTNDKERAIGLVAAPMAAAIGFVVIHTLVVNDPSRYTDGVLNKHYVSLTTYDDLFLVLLGLAVLILVMALLRKRLYLGMVMALYGLAIFNLHYWGLGIPFLMCGAWYLVRAYRLQKALRLARGDAPRFGPNAASNGTSRVERPESNKRYTAPAPTRALGANRQSTKRAG